MRFVAQLKREPKSHAASTTRAYGLRGFIQVVCGISSTARSGHTFALPGNRVLIDFAVACGINLYKITT